MSEKSYASSARPASTIAKWRDDRSVEEGRQEISAGATTGRDEEEARRILLKFETKLELKRYLRDKMNEEHGTYDRFVRINSKLLKCSYEIPADETYDFLKRLHAYLSPGFKRVDGTVSETVRMAFDKSRAIVNRWVSYSDLTVQVFPKTGVVLWIDLECMECKKQRGDHGMLERPRNTVEKHLDTKRIVTSVVRTVTDLGHPDGDVFVTRGKTCGMHFFFPHVILDSEDHTLDVWEAVNRSLESNGHSNALVDTGCSAMPLPMARFHSALNRVKIMDKENKENVPKCDLTMYRLQKPTLKDFARVTNFYHFYKESCPSDTRSNEGSRSSKVKVKRSSKYNVVSDSNSAEEIEAVSPPVTVTVVAEHGTTFKDSDVVPNNGGLITTVQVGSRIDREPFGFISPILQHATLLRDESGPCNEEKEAAEVFQFSTEEGIPEVKRRGSVESVRGRTDTVATEKPNNDTESESTGTQVVTEKDSRFTSDRDKGSVSPTRSECSSKQASSVISLCRTELTNTTGSNDSTSRPLSNASSGRSLVQTDIRVGLARSRESLKRKSDSVGTVGSGSVVTGKKRRLSGCSDSEVDKSPHPPVVDVENASTAGSFLYLADEARSPGLDGLSIFTTTADSGGAPGNDEESGYRESSASTGDRRKCQVVEMECCESSRNNVTRTPTGPSGPGTSSGTFRDTTDFGPHDSSGPTSQRDLDDVQNDLIPVDAHLPQMQFSTTRDIDRDQDTPDGNTRVERERFEANMRLNLDDCPSTVYKTDIEMIVTSLNTDLEFNETMVAKSTPLGYGYGRLRLRPGSSLTCPRENCPAAIYPEYVPHVLYDQDFVCESVWVGVLVRYFDIHMNSAPFLRVFSEMLTADSNVTGGIRENTRLSLLETVDGCLRRFEYDAQVRRSGECPSKSGGREGVAHRPRHGYRDKCTAVIGLMAVCSVAFKMVTPLFTDLARVCKLLVGNDVVTLESLNASTQATAYGDETDWCPLSPDLPDDAEVCGANLTEGDRPHTDERVPSANVGNNHSVIASVLRWNYSALSDQTRWCLFYYYHHVKADALSRITNEVVHGGLMVSAVLQAYFELHNPDRYIEVRDVCGPILKRLNGSLTVAPATASYRNDDRESSIGQSCERNMFIDDSDRAQMPPPKPGRSVKRTSTKGKRAATKSNGSGKAVTSRSDRDDEWDGQENHHDRKRTDRYEYRYKTGYNEVLGLLVKYYLRPVTFDDSTVLYTERGYEPYKTPTYSNLFHDNKTKRAASDLFKEATLEYEMPHGNLLLYNTDVIGTVHRRSTCTNNLVLNIFESMYGGCMTYLTRRVRMYTHLVHRFHSDAYRLVVECRHAMTELVRSVDLSYLNLILRQPVVPPILEQDAGIRQMFMSREEIMSGSFVCLNPMDYVRAVNMFTGRQRKSQDGFNQGKCSVAELFLDRLITNDEMLSYDRDVEARNRFRTVYLFFLLYTFEVLYRIRHSFNRNHRYRATVERLCWAVDIRQLLVIFFGLGEFSVPGGLSHDTLSLLDLKTDPTDAQSKCGRDGYSDTTTSTPRCVVNTRPVVSVSLPDRMSRMSELFGKKGLVVMKSHAPRVRTECEKNSGGSDTDEGIPWVNTVAEASTYNSPRKAGGRTLNGTESSKDGVDGRWRTTDGVCEHRSSGRQREDVIRDREFSDMALTDLERELFSSGTWYENCRVRMNAVTVDVEKTKDLELCLAPDFVENFLQQQVTMHIDNDRLGLIREAVDKGERFEFCQVLPLRVKTMALVLATHAVKRLATDVATDTVRKEYLHENLGVIRCDRRGVEKKKKKKVNGGDDEERDTATERGLEDDSKRPDVEWSSRWSTLLSDRKSMLLFCRSLCQDHFPHNYFVGLRAEEMYNVLYEYMSDNPKYRTLNALKSNEWVKDVCVALNYLLVTTAYDTELVDFCLRLFLGFEWPGQWAKLIFVWKSNSNAGKSYFFEHIVRKAFDQSTSINDPKGGKENAPEKSEYYKNFVLMINEFSNVSAPELKKLCSNSSYKFRMNFGNRMINAFTVGKLVFNCNTLPITTDHATIQRVVLIPLPFWFQKRQSVVDAMLNWTHLPRVLDHYEKNFRINVWYLLTHSERQVFMENKDTKNEDELFIQPNDRTFHSQEQNAKAPMFLVQNKTSQVYMASPYTPTESIVKGIVTVTKYFSRFRFFNTIEHPVNYSKLPTASDQASQEWQRMSQPYFDWKQRYNVTPDSRASTKVSIIHASLYHFSKNHSKNVSFFDLRQHFEFDFAEYKVPYFNAREDEYNVTLDPPDD